MRASPYPLVHLAGLSKTFGATRVLSDVSLTVHGGEVHGLLGENGSGKSTLIKVLAGFHAPDPGASLQVRGADVPLPVAPGAYRDLGISFVHQDLALVGDLSVVENLRVGSVIAGSSPWISWGIQRRSAAALFARYGLDIDPAVAVSSLTETERALVAILRAVEELGATRTLLVLDEPTVFLPREGTDLLFSVVREIVADGRAGVLFVSHDLDEVLAHTDRVTVLRDGVSQGTMPTEGLGTAELAQVIVGRSTALERAADAAGAVLTPAPVPAAASSAPVAQVEDLSAHRARRVSFTVTAGESVGLTGISGSGYDDVLPALYGARPAQAGTLTVGGVTHDLPQMTPGRALAERVVYIPPDRKVEGSAPELTVEENVTLPVLDAVGRRARPGRRSAGLLSAARLRARATELAERYDVRPRRPEAVYAALSGGNQQKALLGKWLQTSPALVLLAEPTQGVDVGARTHIFDLLRQVAADGAGIVVASSDYDQLATVCQRVLVFSRGAVVAELTGDEVTKDHISDSVLGLTAALQEVSA